MRQGFTLIELVVGVALVALVGSLGVYVLQSKSRVRDTRPVTPTSQNSPVGTNVSSSPSSPSSTKSTIVWQQTGEGWQAMGTPPTCPKPLQFKAPADISLATGILYPGQTRGGNYKPHGGFRFDTSQNAEITVSAPMDANVVNGGQYLVNGEKQYTFDFINSCGIMYRLGHLLVLTPKFQQIADKFPAAKEGDSRTERVEPQVAVTQGEPIATSVGVTKGTSNTFFDWGVYDLRQKNEASKDPAWAATHDPELAQRALCWFDLLPASDAAKVKSLPPGDPESGSTSDYCK